MIQQHTSSVLVVDEEEIRGIITERDLVEHVIGNAKSYTDHAETIMTLDPITISRFD
ncbi:CBS domain-containing protein [Cytobacillus sp. S13-E01]|uniref:CBS domain-containing protein n=1 Tax=Cytobacillus sp. S13-E01 TaxID=3031326 RepID=UPI0023D838BD|nr:CBS domain-containing protein [Cytobacillus sp. S13-E01]MDF0726563.1 CBS domain-containing protein [Cytobacillus sp. S13-E01]